MPTEKKLKDLELHEELEIIKEDGQEVKVIKVPDGYWYIYILGSTREIDPLACTSVFVPYQPPKQKTTK